MTGPRRALTAAKLAADSIRHLRAGLRFAQGLPPRSPGPALEGSGANPLESYFDNVTEGPGIHKWRHQLHVYHRHLHKFAGRWPHFLEIGVQSGGSLPMWLDYFGDGCQVYGVDIDPACKAHEREGVRVFIGDQTDPAFWARVTAGVPRIDAVVDDGGHRPEDQIAAMRNLLPHLAYGGVYICEDITDGFQQMHSFVDGMTRPLSHVEDDAEPLPVHQHIASVHRYPGMVVVEKPDGPVQRFWSERHGTVWQPDMTNVLTSKAGTATTAGPRRGLRR
jgi:SAM-dependent methyltransferase